MVPDALYLLSIKGTQGYHLNVTADDPVVDVYSQESTEGHNINVATHSLGSTKIHVSLPDGYGFTRTLVVKER